jgi:hypothetical protein
VLGVITSFHEQIEWHLRILSLHVGLAVGVLSLIGLCRKLRGREPAYCLVADGGGPVGSRFGILVDKDGGLGEAGHSPVVAVARFLPAQ